MNDVCVLLNAGHIHYSRFSGPIFMGRVLSNGTHNPRGTIHATSGNAGPPALSACTCDVHNATVGGSGKQCEICISQLYSYTRLTVRPLILCIISVHTPHETDLEARTDQARL